MLVRDIHATIHEEPFDPPKHRPFVSINMVSSLDGKAAISGRASGLGSQYDRVVMNTLRSSHDAIMVGAGTIRAEKYSPKLPEPLAKTRLSRSLRPQPWLILPTTAGRIPKENLLDIIPDNTIILKSKGHGGYDGESGEDTVERMEEIPTNDDNTMDLAYALWLLRSKYEISRLLVEGGPTLNHHLFESGLVDQLFLTIAPKLTGGSADETLAILQGKALGTPLQAIMVAIHAVQDELFLRYGIQGEQSFQSP